MGRIRSGAYPDGKKVDSEPFLCRKFDFSRNTVRQAVQELENEGYLYRIRGKGTFVRNATPVNSRRIAMMIYDTAYMTHPVTARVICGIDRVLTKAGFILDILASKRSFHDENLTRLSEAYAGFLIGCYQLDELTLQELKKLSVPHLFVKNHPKNSSVAAARIHYEHAGFLAAEHLIRTGCRELSLIYSGEEMAISAEFCKGVFSAALESGVRLRSKNIFTIDFNRADDIVGTSSEILRRADRPDGIVCAADELAIPLLRELKKHGIAVPGEISVIGCNNINVSEMSDPPLSTVALPLEKLGELAARVLLDRILLGKEMTSFLLEPSLVLRKTTGNALSGAAVLPGTE